MRKIIFYVAVAVSVFFHVSPIFAQDVAVTKIVKGESMDQFAPRVDSVTAQYFGLYRYGAGPNLPERVGCIVNFCPQFVSINNFAFGNITAFASSYRYNWTAKVKVIAFSVSTIEFDPFANEISGASKVIPNAKTFKLSDPSMRSFLSNIDPDTEYVSTFFGQASSAKLFEHQTVGETILKHLPPHFKDFVDFGYAEPVNNIENLAETRGGIQSGEEPTGYSTRFTVVTFVSHVRYIDASGKPKFWDFKPEAYSGSLLDQVTHIVTPLPENHGTDLFIFSRFIAKGEIAVANEYLSMVMKKWTSGTPPKTKQ